MDGYGVMIFSATINGWDLKGAHNGCQWIIDVQNIYDIFNGRSNNLSTGQNVFNGGYYSNIPTYAGRSFTISGAINGPTVSAIIQTVEDFKKVLNLQSMRFSYMVDTLDRYMTVQLGSSGLTLKWEGPHLITYSLPLVCLDGLSYGKQFNYSTGLPSTIGGMQLPVQYDGLQFSENVISGVIRFNYNGTAPAPLTIIFQNVQQPTIKIYPSGDQITLTSGNTGNKNIIIDSNNMTILLSNGNNLYNSATVRQWPHALPGVNYLLFSSPFYSPLASCTVRGVEVFQ